MGASVQAWESSLSPEDRQAWNDYAQEVPVTNSLGAAINLSGLQWFNRINQPRIAANSRYIQAGSVPPLGSLLTSPPAVLTTGEPVTSLVQTTVTPASFMIEAAFATPASAAGTLVLYVGPPVSEGTTYYKGPYQLAGSIGYLNAADAAIIDLDPTDPGVYLAAASPIAGQRLPVRLVAYYVDGRNSQSWSGYVPVTTAP
jgi:hypothetical protein